MTQDKIVRLADVKKASPAEARAVELFKRIEREKQLPVARIETRRAYFHDRPDSVRREVVYLNVQMEDGKRAGYTFYPIKDQLVEG